MRNIKRKMAAGALIVMFSTGANAAWRTCIPSQCSQKQATFDTWQDCANYQRYQGSAWAKCFQV